MRRILIFITNILFSIHAFTQMTENIVVFPSSKNLINPAAIAYKNGAQVNITGSRLFNGISKHPENLTFSLDGKLGSKVGLGFYFISENVGVFTNNYAFLNYAYLIKLGNAGFIRMGINGGLIDRNFNSSTYVLNNPGDPLVNQYENVKIFDLNAGGGLEFDLNKFKIGASMKNIIKSTSSSQNLDLNGNYYGISQNLNMYAQYQIDLNKGFGIMPILKYKNLTGFKPIYEFYAMSNYKNILHLGLYGNTNSALGFLGGISVKDHIRVDYVKRINRKTNLFGPSQEIGINFFIKSKEAKKQETHNKKESKKEALAKQEELKRIEFEKEQEALRLKEIEIEREKKRKEREKLEAQEALIKQKEREEHLKRFEEKLKQELDSIMNLKSSGNTTINDTVFVKKVVVIQSSDTIDEKDINSKGKKQQTDTVQLSTNSFEFVYLIAAGSFIDRPKAEKMVNDLKEHDLKIYFDNKSNKYFVYKYKFNTIAETQVAFEKLKNAPILYWIKELKLK